MNPRVAHMLALIRCLTIPPPALTSAAPSPRRPRGRRAAERDQQLPPSDGDCHTPLPCEVRKWNDTTPKSALSLSARQALAPL